MVWEHLLQVRCGAMTLVDRLFGLVVITVGLLSSALIVMAIF